MLDFSTHSSVTLVFTDIEGSTVLWEHFGDEFIDILDIHNRIMRKSIQAHCGYEVKTEGDSFMIAFPEPSDAVRFCLDAQHMLNEANWPDELRSPNISSLSGTNTDGTFRGLRVRMGIHTGNPVERKDPVTGRSDFFGPDVNRAARLSSAGHGGQLLISDATWAALGAMDLVVVEDLGEHALRGLESRERIRQLLPPSLSSRRFPKLKTPELRKTNLPARVDSFIGRADALTELGSRVEKGQHLITILGTGGLGKTRLALRFAAEQLEHFPGGVWFCDLSEAHSLEAFIQTVGHAIGSPLNNVNILEQLGNTLAQRKRVLVVLDNFEQIVDAAAKSVASWMLHAPEAIFIVTSRIRLNIGGEHVYNLRPHDFEEAVHLFEERARANVSDFVLNDENRLVVEEIVTKLDGIALAVELAAARIQLLEPAQILERLSHRFRLLRAKRRDRTARQTTLQGAIDWSWEMLKPWEQLALAQCSVFKGGFDLKAAEAVLDLGDCAELVMDVIETLIDHSLLHTRESKIGDCRVGIFESIQAYAAQKLEEGGTAAVHRLRHARYYAELGTDESLDALFIHGGVARQQALTLELDNLKQSVTIGLSQGAIDVAAQAALAAIFVFRSKGPIQDGLSLAELVMSSDGCTPRFKARLGFRNGIMLRQVGRLDESLAELENSYQLYLKLEDQRSAWCVLSGIAIVKVNMGKVDEAGAHYEAALAGLREEGDRCNEGKILANLGNFYQQKNETERAAIYFETAIAIHREVGNRVFEGAALGNLGCMRDGQGQILSARANFEEALFIHREVGNRFFEGIELGNLAGILDLQSEFEKSCEYYKLSIEILDELWPLRSMTLRGQLALLYTRLGQLDEAEVLVQQAENFVRPDYPDYDGQLSCQKGLIAHHLGHLDVAKSALEDASKIAKELKLSPETHLKKMIAKLEDVLAGTK